MDNNDDATVSPLPHRGQMQVPSATPTNPKLARRKQDLEYQRILDATKQGVWTIDIEGRTTFVNDRMAELLGYSPDDMMGRVHTDFMWDEDRPKGDEEMELRRQGKWGTWDQRYRRKDGTELWTLASCNSLFDDEGRVVGALGMFADITERKRAEKDLRNNHELISVALKSAGAGVWSWDARTDELVWSPEQYELYGLDPGHPITAVQWQALLHPEDRDRMSGFIEALRSSPQDCRVEYRIRRPNGERWILAVGHLERESDGSAKRYVGINLDITERKVAENRIRESAAEAERFDAELRATTDELESFVGSVPVGVGLFDRTCRCLRVNQALADLNGLPVSEHLGRRLTDIVPSIAASLVPRITQVFATGEATGHFEVCGYTQRATQAERHWLCGLYPVYRQPGAVSAVGVWVVDITDRRRTEESLRRSAENLRLLGENSPDVLAIQDRDLRYEMIVNPPLGWDPVETVGKTDRELLDPQQFETINVLKQSVMRSGEAMKLDIPLKDSRGAMRFYQGAYIPRRDTSGAVTGVLSYFRDITELKQAEEALRESERRERDRANELAVLLESVPVSVFITRDSSHSHLTGNRLAEKLLRQPRGGELSLTGPEEARPKGFRLIKDGRELAPDERPSRRAARGEPVDNFEFSIVHDDGNVRHLSGYANPLFDKEGHPCGAIACLIDITGHKLAEEALRSSQATLVAALESMGDAMYIADSAGNLVQFNEAFARYLRFREKRECAKTFAEYPGLFDVCTAEDVPAPPEDWAVPRALRGETATNVEFKLRRKDTGEAWIGSYSFGPIRDGDGSITGAVVTARDITERKRAEQRLRDSQATLAAALESMMDGVLIVDPAGNCRAPGQAQSFR